MTHCVLIPVAASLGTPPAAPARTVLDFIADGGPMGVVLIGLSVTAVALVIACVAKLRRSVWAPPDVLTNLGRLIREHDVEGARRYCADPVNACFTTAVVGTALARCSRSAFGFLELRTALEEAGQVETDRQYRAIDFIALIAALGPMLGLLGTVFALIGAFSSLAAMEGAARSQALAGHMSLALVNTAEGLAVAIPCTAFYAYFKRRADRLANDVGYLIEEIAMPLEGRQSVTAPSAKPVAKAGTPDKRPAKTTAEGAA